MLTNRTPDAQHRTSPTGPRLQPDPRMPWPDSLSQVVADLATTAARLDGLITALEAIGHKGEAAAAYHVSLQVRSLRGRVDRLQRWTGL